MLDNEAVGLGFFSQRQQDGNETQPIVRSVREALKHWGATNPAKNTNSVDCCASRIIDGTGRLGIESGTQAPQLGIGRWKQVCYCSAGKLPVRVHL
jgi:hypothetical protein